MNSEKYRNKLGNKHPGILRIKNVFHIIVFDKQWNLSKPYLFYTKIIPLYYSKHGLWSQVYLL